MRIQICGRIVIEYDGERLEGSLPGRQGRILFAYLVLHRHRLTPREEIIDTLWRGSPRDTADRTLSVLLSRLRKSVGPARIHGRGTVQLVLDAAWIDLEAAEEAIHGAESAIAVEDWPRAWAKAQGALFTARRGFLPGEDAPWIDEVRRRLDTIGIRALEAYGRAALGIGHGELAAAREAGRALVDMAPLRESGHRLLMQALAAEGNVAEALRAYARLEARLRNELGIEPSDPTQRLYEELLGGP